jgi:hypothetical protein
VHGKANLTIKPGLLAYHRCSKVRGSTSKSVYCDGHQSQKGLDHGMLRGYETGKFPPFRGIWGVHECLSAMQEDL